MENLISFVSNSDKADFFIRSRFIQVCGKDFEDLQTITGIVNVTLEELNNFVIRCFGSNAYRTFNFQSYSNCFDIEQSLDSDASFSKIFKEITDSEKLTDDVFLSITDDSYVEKNEIKRMIVFKKLNIGVVLIHFPFERASSVTVLSLNEMESSKLITDFIRNLHSFIKSKITPKEDDFNSQFKLITKTQRGFDTMDFDFDYEKYKDMNVDTHYNDDFKPVSDKIISHLNTKKSAGITILHGDPGTGKTTFLRYLISKVQKDVIYLPPDMTTILSDPSLIDFIKSQSNSIFIIEDGEEVLRKRGETANSTAVSNMLNVSDGILADILHFNFVVTINCDIDEIDPALRRPGRLVAEYKFGKLNKEKSKILIKQLYDQDEDCTDMTLAEIYSLNETKFVHKKKKNGVGFTADIYG
jgi:hypothetical protein